MLVMRTSRPSRTRDLSRDGIRAGHTAPDLGPLARAALPRPRSAAARSQASTVTTPGRADRARKTVAHLHTAGVTTLLPGTAAAISPAVTSGRSRRWRRVLVAVIGLLLLAALVTGGWLRNYQPMRSGQVAGVDASGLEVRDNVLGIEYRVIEPTPGDTITLLMSLRNDGPLGSTIVGVEQPFNPDGVVDLASFAETTTPARLELADPRTGLLSPITAPFTLAPGAAYEARVSFGVLECATELGAPGSTNWSTTLPVTYRVLGMNRTVDLDIGYAIALESLPNCPFT